MPEGTLEMARQSYAVAYVTAVCATTLLYDYFLTFGDEIRRVWPTRLTVPKILFFLNRYVVLPMLVFNGIASTRSHLSPGLYVSPRPTAGTSQNNGTFACSCVFYLRWLVIATTVTNFVVEGILLTRVIALYRDNMPVIAVASFLYVGGTITLIALSIQDYVGEDVRIVQDFSALPGCYAASVPAMIAGYWITPPIIESTFFGLVVWRVIAWSRDNMDVPPTLVLVARDSTAYFAIVFALLFVNLFVFEYGPPFLSSLFVTPVNTAGCIAGSHMLLNLRALAHTDTGLTDTEIEMERLSRLRFSSRPSVKRTKPGETSISTITTATTTTTTELADYSRGTQPATQYELDELDKKKEPKASTAVITFALPSMTASATSSTSGASSGAVWV